MRYMLEGHFTEPDMKTVTDNMRERAQEIKSLGETLILHHSSIHRWYERRSTDSLVWMGGDHAWSPLDKEGCRIQSRALEQYNKFQMILGSLMKNQPKGTMDDLQGSDSTIRPIIGQEGNLWDDRREEYYKEFYEALDKQIALLEGLYDSSDGSVIYVPDTNALLYNPALEDWRFVDSPRFIILLTPTVLSELDTLKVNHRVEDVRGKAEGLIKRIKGYRTRGKLAEGVSLVGNISQLMTLAVEPTFDKSISWLDESNNDDRIIATFIEIMRQHPRSTAVLVTRDINLQNKAEFANLPFEEPPTPCKDEGTR